MNIRRRQIFGADGGDIKKRPRRLRERTPREVDVDFVGEYENSSSGHTFGYGNARGRDKPFSCQRKTCFSFSSSSDH